MQRKIILIVSLVIAAFLVQSVAAANNSSGNIGSLGKINNLLSADFSSSSSDWNVEYGGRWRRVDGVYEGIRQSSWAGDKTWTNYRMTCRARYMEGGQEGQIWLSFRYHDEWNRYAIALRDGLLDEVMLLRYREVDPPEPDVFCPLNVPLGFEPEEGQWYTFQIEVQGNHIKIWVGDVNEPQIDYLDDKPIETGTIALGGGYHRCQFDDVRVEMLPPSKPLEGIFLPEARRFNFGPTGEPR